ncbi:hypothetical protein Vafri_4911 [Volvox africanus]|uniref:Proline dehydrogenase n=1 Tax=Volvox africanus TaxID=51714 RepID=A0A8J4EV46_9CHLO|nr:hypothetical protein Vafri_4911 [Volvox africanus]
MLSASKIPGIALSAAAALAGGTTPAFGIGCSVASGATLRAAVLTLIHGDELCTTSSSSSTATATATGGVTVRAFGATAASSSPVRAAAATGTAAALPSRDLPSASVTSISSTNPTVAAGGAATFSGCNEASRPHGSLGAGNEAGPGAGNEAGPSSQRDFSDTPTAATAATATTSTPALSFSDYRTIFEGQSTWQLLRAYGVLRICGFKPLVHHAEALLATSRRLVGEKATDNLVKSTFFAHFCAGEDVPEVQGTVDRLQAVGVGAILDYAAEDDVGPTTAAAAKQAAPGAEPAVEAASGLSEPSPRALGVVGRTYDYASEDQCDRHVDHFLAAIEMAALQPGRPAFAAIKMTALGNPELLQRASSAITMLHGLFSRFDEDGSGFIDSQEFLRQWKRLVGSGLGAAGDLGAAGALASQAEGTFRWLDTQGTGKVDYVSWCQRLDLRHMPMLAARIAEGGGGDGDSSQEVAEACLNGEEVKLMDALLGRLQRLVTAALRLDMRLMVDAEHTYFQPAIEHVTLRLMREHNRNGLARVLNTYQAYLVDSRDRLLRDMERARREGWVLGAKLVRGAYLHLERRRAQQLGLPSPVWATLEQTHANYDSCVEDLLAGVQQGRAEVLLGTHNQESVETAVARMAAMGLPSSSPPGTPGVMFGQLLGMSDHLTLTLGKAGYRAYKYVPYGRVGQVMPYLLRRAAENQDIMKGSKQDLVMLRSELRRRAAAVLRFGTGAA